MTAFTVERGLVVMDTTSGPVRLSPQSVEDLLNIFQRENEHAAFNALHDAHKRAGGIPMVSSFRRVA